MEARFPVPVVIEATKIWVSEWPLFFKALILAFSKIHCPSQDYMFLPILFPSLECFSTLSTAFCFPSLGSGSPSSLESFSMTPSPFVVLTTPLTPGYGLGEHG